MTRSVPVQAGLFDAGDDVGLAAPDVRVLELLAAGGTVVVRLPGIYRPYGPLLRHLADAGLLVRIGRGTMWGNRHRLRPGATPGERAEAIAAYERDLAGRPDLLAHVGELRGRALGCWCAPRACYGDVLARLANGRPTGTALDLSEAGGIITATTATRGRTR